MSLQSWTCKDCIKTEMRITPDGEIAEYCKFTDDYGHTNRTEWHGDLVTCLDKQTKHDEVIKCYDKQETRKYFASMRTDVNKWRSISGGTKMNGYLMVMKSDGTPTPLGKVSEINVITESPTPEPPLVHIADDAEFTAKVALTKKDKKVWAKILNMPKFALTEWTFPRKKKRGTKRRIRKAYRQLSKIFELEKKTWMI